MIRTGCRASVRVKVLNILDWTDYCCRVSFGGELISREMGWMRLNLAKLN